MSAEFRVDPARANRRDSTGFYVRAIDHGKWGSHDIAELELPALLLWLQRGGGRNRTAEVTVAMLLGHSRAEIDKLYNEDGDVVPLTD